jgi:hypothetical protein
MHLRSKRIVFWRKNSQQLIAQNIGFCKCHFKHFQFAVYLNIQKEIYIYISLGIYIYISLGISCTAFALICTTMVLNCFVVCVCVCVCVGALIMCILWISSATLTEVFPCFFLNCKANARVKFAKTGHGQHSSKFVVCVVCLLFVLLCC